MSSVKGAPYVPLPKNSVRGILEFAELDRDGAFYDLGCGDGRVLIGAVKISGVKKASGYEISPWPYLKAKFLVRREKLGNKIEILRQNLFNADLSQADAVFAYLYPKVIGKLALKFSRELKPEAKIICVSFPIESPEKFSLKLIKSGKVGRFTVSLYEKT